MIFRDRLTPFAIVALLGFAVAAYATGDPGPAEPTPAPEPKVREVVPHAKFVKVYGLYHRADRRADRLARVLRHEETYQETLALAHLVYPGADESLADRIMGCESGHRAWAKNPTSSAGGRAQYLDTTWASTPEGKAGLSRFDPVAGVFAIMRHLHNSGNDATPWTASRGCWG